MLKIAVIAIILYSLSTTTAPDHISKQRSREERLNGGYFRPLASSLPAVTIHSSHYIVAYQKLSTGTLSQTRVIYNNHQCYPLAKMVTVIQSRKYVISHEILGQGVPVRHKYVT